MPATVSPVSKGNVVKWTCPSWSTVKSIRLSSLPGNSSWRGGSAPMAASGVRTGGNASYSTRTFSAARAARSGVSATTAATSSP